MFTRHSWLLLLIALSCGCGTDSSVGRNDDGGTLRDGGGGEGGTIAPTGGSGGSAAEDSGIGDAQVPPEPDASSGMDASDGSDDAGGMNMSCGMDATTSELACVPDSGADEDAEVAVDAETDSGGEEPVEPSRDCVVSKPLELRGSTIPSASNYVNGGVTVVTSLEDCDGVPFTSIEAGDLVVIEDSQIVATPAALLPRSGLRVFVHLALQVGNETASQQAATVNAAKSFVERLMGDSDVPVQIQVSTFDGDLHYEVVRYFPLPFSNDAATVQDEIDDISTLLLTDPTSADLFGAMRLGREQLLEIEAAYGRWGYGGAFTTTYLVVVASGADREGSSDLATTVTALSNAPDRVLAVGLETAQANPESLRALARDGYFDSGDAGAVAAAFDELGDRMLAQIAATYVVGYCTTKGSQQHAVGVSLAGAMQRVTGSLPMYGTNDPTCTLAALSNACEGVGCGGNGCGTCGDFATQRCGSGDSSSFPFPTIEVYECEDGPPETHPVPGEVLEHCGNCQIPGRCCTDYTGETSSFCFSSSNSCGSYNYVRTCDDSGDCTPGSYCCNYQCALQCNGSIMCRNDADCAFVGGTCGTDHRCDIPEPPDAGGP